MFSAETGRQQTVMGFAILFVPAFVHNPPGPFHERSEHRCRKNLPGTLGKPVGDPQHLAVGIPLPFLGLEIPAQFLAAGKPWIRRSHLWSSPKPSRAFIIRHASRNQNRR